MQRSGISLMGLRHGPLPPRSEERSGKAIVPEMLKLLFNSRQASSSSFCRAASSAASARTPSADQLIPWRLQRPDTAQSSNFSTRVLAIHSPTRRRITGVGDVRAAGSDPFLSAHAAIPVVVVSACLSRWFQRPAL